jgi:hypothetical protein
MNTIIHRYYFFLLLTVLLLGCAHDHKKFRLIPSHESGVTFKNTLTESVEFNIFNYMYFYNGGGVAVGDFNGDELPDIYFTANQLPNKLYLNKGNFKFDDITEYAGVQGFNGWTTGVTTADVNNDGKLDIYVSYLGDYLIYKSKNQLFINLGNDEKGIPQFADKAMECGLDLVGFSTQAAFFDYDRDGDLDMFMLNHSLHQQGTFGKSTLRNNIHALAGDKLMRNDNGHFVDVSQASGIYSSVLGYGLGVVVSDVNLDGWMDIYVGNDFHENDYLYINQGDGTFKESLERSMMHTSRYTMGVDFADFNNDAFPDLVSMDMLPEDPLVLKASAAEDNFDVYNFKLNFGYNHQVARNVLQLNNHDGTFSEIALMAGVAATDWSWSALFADVDLDGHKDILVANGILRRSNDLDYINFIEVDSIQRKLGEDLEKGELRYIEKMPKIKIPNYLYINNRDSTFTNKAMEWGLEQPSYSHGAAYADLDNDGDLDLIMNNVDDEAFLYENKIRNSKNNETTQQPHFLQVVLKGKTGNYFGIGTKIFLYDRGSLQMQECIPTRGYQSAVDYTVTFGTSAHPVDSVVVVWNDGTFHTLINVKIDQRIILHQKNASGVFDYSIFHNTDGLIKNASGEFNIPFKHKENKFVEFNREQLIPHMVSAEGPASAVADVNGDKREDIFFGGGKWQPGSIFIQTPSGTFVASPQPMLDADSVYEDVDAVFFDADGDQDYDLFVVSGGNEFSGKSPFRMPRLYLNDGKGLFAKANHHLPELYLNGSCVSIGDIDNDNDPDVFLGARSIPWKYGVKPDSYILCNDGNGKFVNATSNLAPSLKEFGLVKHAVWADIDNDNDKDLLIAAEWQPITILLNNNGKLTPMPLEDSGLEKSNGWWNVLQTGDFDHDGDQDIVAGNLGLNSKLKASLSEPVRMYVADVDKNDSIDQIVTHVVRGKEYPFHTRDEMTKQLPALKKKYLSYHKFAQATVQDIFGDDIFEEALKYEAYEFQSSYIENLGNYKFKIHPLPKAAQLSTVNALCIEDVDRDKNLDILLAGNFYPINIQMGRNDGSYGLLLKGNGRNGFTPIPGITSGFVVNGETRAIRKINISDNRCYLAIRNNDSIKIYIRLK